MVQSFLFDWIDAETGAATIRVQHCFSIFVLSHKAKASITDFQMAHAETELAEDSAIGWCGPPTPGKSPFGVSTITIGRAELTISDSLACELKNDLTHAIFSAAPPSIDLGLNLPAMSCPETVKNQ
jgi:hypothetical protein